MNADIEHNIPGTFNYISLCFIGVLNLSNERPLWILIFYELCTGKYEHFSTDNKRRGWREGKERKLAQTLRCAHMTPDKLERSKNNMRQTTQALNCFQAWLSLKNINVDWAAVTRRLIDQSYRATVQENMKIWRCVVWQQCSPGLVTELFVLAEANKW